MLGPLAPRRDAGAGAATYGTMPNRLLNMPNSLERSEWGLRKGDRVAVTDGTHRERGKIGTIREIKKNQQMVYVQGMNMVGDSLSSPLLPDSRASVTAS